MKKNIYLMYAIAFLQGMVFYGPIAALYRQAQGVSVFQITLIESISLVLCILLEIPWGIAADKIGYRRTIIFCCCLYFMSKIVFWKASGFGGFLTERVMLSAVMAGFLTVISYGISAVLSFFLSEVRQNISNQVHREQFKKTLRETLKNPRLLLFLGAAALLSETHQTITVFLNQLQYQRCGLGDSAIGIIYIIITIAGMCGVWSLAVTRKAGKLLSVLIFCGTAVISCITLAWIPSAAFSVAAILALRISNSLFQPFQAELQNRQIRAENRATALSINAMVIDLIAIGTNLIFGALAEYELSMAFLFGGGICFVSLIIFCRTISS